MFARFPSAMRCLALLCLTTTIRLALALAAVSVRDLTRRDVLSVATLLRDCFAPPAGYNAVEGGLLVAETSLSLSERIGPSSSSVMLVAAEEAAAAERSRGGGIVGFVKLDLGVRAVKGWDAALPLSTYVSSLAVAPPYRRRGVARALMQAAEERARGAGFSEISLQVEEENAAAAALYANSGYEVIGRDADARKLVGDIIFGRSERVVKLALHKVLSEEEDS